jgi:hypothetical protein
MDWGPSGFPYRKIPIFLCGQTSVHPQEDLAKFCYQPDMKI